MTYTVLLLALASVVAGETIQERGERVVNEALAALGGDKFLAMQDRVEEGRAYSFYHGRLTGLSLAKVYTRYTKTPPPDGGVAQVERQAFGKNQDYSFLFVQDKAYEVTFRGAKPLEDLRRERYLRSTRHNILYILRQRLKEPGLLFDGRGADVWQNTPVQVVDITDTKNNVVRVFFDRNTKLPVRQVYVTRDTKTGDRDEYAITFAKYRDIGDGVQWPFHIRTERNGEKTFEMFADAVSIHEDLPDAVFDLGAKAKDLRAYK